MLKVDTGLLYSNSRNQMTHFCGRTHSTRLRPQPVTIPLETAPVYAAPAREEIAALAYSYWEKRGRRGGSPLEDWLRAEAELKQHK